MNTPEQLVETLPAHAFVVSQAFADAAAEQDRQRRILSAAVIIAAMNVGLQPFWGPSQAMPKLQPLRPGWPDCSLSARQALIKREFSHINGLSDEEKEKKKKSWNDEQEIAGTSNGVPAIRLIFGNGRFKGICTSVETKYSYGETRERELDEAHTCWKPQHIQVKISIVLPPNARRVTIEEARKWLLLPQLQTFCGVQQVKRLQ